MSDNDEIFSEFLEEAQELLANFESCLKELDEDHSQSDKVAEAFRHIHTLKGNSSCFSMTDLTEIAHVMEDVMSRARNGTIKISSNLIDDLLVGVDRVGAILNEPDKDHGIDTAEIMTLFTKHNQLNGVTFSPEETKENVNNPYLDINIKSPNFIYWIRCTKSDSSELLSELGELGKIHKHDSGVDYDDFLFESVLEKNFLQVLKYEIHVEEILEKSDLVLENKKESITEIKNQEYSNRESFARINYQLLDQLMELSGEIILCRNQFTRKLPPELLQDFHALSVLINDMQDGLMMTRMQPFKVVSGKFPRMIRETARKLNKKVKFEIQGEKIELDRSILESAKSIFTHVVRNSLDHGIETPEERITSGKCGEGLLQLKVTQTTGYVKFVVSDDGRGINYEKLKSKAVEEGILTKEQSESISDESIINLIYKPGISTAEVVSDISGRGVGMDVVKTEVEKMGGSISLKSELGKGTEVTIKLPQSMAILHSLVVRSRKQSYAIPRNNISEVLKITKDQSDVFQDVEGATLLKHRGRLLPLLNLNVMIESCGESTSQNSKSLQTSCYPVTIVVIKQMEKSYGLIVDEVQYQEEVVIKPLNEFLESFKIFTGMTILSTGKVCFILDTHSLAEKGEIQYSEIVSISDKSSKSFSNESYFVFENCPNERYAIPIGQVEMIHQFKVSELARCGHDYFVDIVGKEYKVVDLVNYVPSRAKNIFEEDDNIYIVRLKGLICDWVLGCKNLIGRKDYENNLQFLSTDCEVIVGQLIKGQTVTSFLDIISIDLKRSAIKVNGSEEVLIVDDSRVVRNMMSQIFKSHGYKPITAENGSQAIQILQNTEVSIIFSDLEMPGMNGFEMAVEIKEKDLSKATLVAFSSFKSDEFKSKAFESGYDHFLVKYDHENLLKYLEKDSA